MPIDLIWALVAAAAGWALRHYNLIGGEPQQKPTQPQPQQPTDTGRPLLDLLHRLFDERLKPASPEGQVKDSDLLQLLRDLLGAKPAP